MNQNINNENLKNIHYLIEQLDKCKIDSDKFYNILLTIIKKYFKNTSISKNVHKNMKEKIFDNDFYELLNGMQDSNKFISIILS
jgi:hypothetical protein